MIEYFGIQKAFSGQVVLGGVDLRVERGEMFGVFGPSGTGKSVLLKTTIGLIAPDAGYIEVDGARVVLEDGKALARIRRKVGYVFQNAALFDSLNVWENVETGIPEDELKRLTRREVTRRIWESMELVNLEPAEVVRKLPSELSGGMRKRVGIARAIVGRPEILLWDEPTTGLDPVNTAAVERLIEQLSQTLNVTSVIVTHDIEGGLLMCDRVAMLQGGRLRFCGSPEAFRSSDDPLVRAFVDRSAAQAALDQMEIQ
jgi:phospholipid/cholesterol/gamma-HCH transport system ATP-binding protein